MADYLVTDTELTGVADAIRTKTGGSEAISFPTGFTDAIDGIVTLAEGTANANATAGDIKNGKTAYVNGTKITGTYSPHAVAYLNQTCTKTISVTSGRKVQGNPIATYSRPSNEVWNSGTLNAQITGTSNISGGISLSASSDAISIVATSTFTMSSSGTVVVRYIASAVAEVVS